MSQSSSPGRRKHSTKIKPGVRRVAGLAAVIAATAALTSIPTAAQAADPITTKGDILLTAAGSALVTPGRVDKINPATGVAAVASSFTNGDFADAMAALPNGDFVVAFVDGRLVRVDHLSGAQRTIRFASGTFPWADLAADANGDLFALLRGNTGTELVLSGRADWCADRGGDAADLRRAEPRGGVGRPGARSPATTSFSVSLLPSARRVR